MKAIIPAAGLGTRFLPYTKSQPKEMLPVVDKPAIQYVVEEALESGMTDVIIVTGRGKRAIEDHFDRAVEHEEFLRKAGDTSRLEELERLWKKVNILYVRQKEPRGLGHAILTAEPYVRDGPFAVLLGDDITIDREPCIAQIERAFKQSGDSIVGAIRVDRKRIPNYGMIVGQPSDGNLVRIWDIIEKPAPDAVISDLAAVGRYILQPRIFDHLRAAQENRTGEIQLTDAIRELSRETTIYAHIFRGRRYDVGDKIDWIRANLELAMERPDIGPAVRALLAELSHAAAH